MAEYTERETERASKIIGDLLDQERRTEEFEKGFSVADVEADTDQFLEELLLLDYFGVNFPAMNVADGPPVPVSLSLFGLPWPLGRGGPFARSRRRAPDPFWYYYRDALYSVLRGPEGPFGDVPTLSHEVARENFSIRAQKFLATRLAALRSHTAGRPPSPPPPTLNMPQFLGGPPVQVSGCHFSVNTNSPGLTAYWSGACYISPNYLGAPTSPAVGVLQAGTYVFGINGAAYGNTVQWDTNAVCSLPGVPSVHLQY